VRWFKRWRESRERRRQELNVLRYGDAGCGPCIVQEVRDRADRDLWAVIRITGPLLILAMAGMWLFAWWME